MVIIIPAYNEEEAIGPLLDEIQTNMQENRCEFSTVVVDDGSVDRTADAVRERVGEMPVRLVQHDGNKGLAAAIRTGLLAALEQGADRDIIVTMDGDNTHAPGLILRMVRSIREGCDVVIASRYQPGSRVIGVPGHRRLLSSGASLLFRLALPIPGVKDYTCGYRAYRIEVLRQAVEELGDRIITEHGFACMVELLLRMRRIGAVMAEVPMILRYDRKPGKSKMDVRRTVLETLKLLARERFGAKWRRSGGIGA